MSHTPGPWRVHSEVPNRIILNGSACYEVECSTSESALCNRADVRLMAAAPRMLAVLRQAQADLELLDESGDEVGWRNMDATEVDQLIGHLLYTVDKCINRAEGRTDG